MGNRSSVQQGGDFESALQIVHETYDSQGRVDAVETGLAVQFYMDRADLERCNANEGNVTISFYTSRPRISLRAMSKD